MALDKRCLMIFPAKRKRETPDPACRLVAAIALLSAMVHGCSGPAVTEVDVTQRSLRFGTELRKRRLAADLTLTELSRRVHYSKAQLSKVERNLKSPSRELVRLCDAALNANGALIAMLEPEHLKTSDATATGGDEEVWSMQLSPDGKNTFQPLSRRQVVTAGAASIPAFKIGRTPAVPNTTDNPLIDTYRSMFDQYRRLGQAADTGLLIPALIAQTHSLRELTRHANPQARQRLLRLGSRYAEYIGWLVQETGDDQGALWWTQRAVELAAAGGDHHLAAYGLVRRALVTLYREDTRETIRLAQRAQAAKTPPRIQGLAAQREAQGHALAGDYDACMRSLDRARTFLARPATSSDEPVLGTTNLVDPAQMITGWCLYDLGRPGAAAEIFDRQTALIPQRAVRTRVRYGMRRALAHATAGEVDHACHLASELLPDAATVNSATIATDMRKLVRTLSRHPKNAAVRALTPELTTALRHTP